MLRRLLRCALQGTYSRDHIALASVGLPEQEMPLGLLRLQGEDAPAFFHCQVKVAVLEIECPECQMGRHSVRRELDRFGKGCLGLGKALLLPVG